MTKRTNRDYTETGTPTKAIPETPPITHSPWKVEVTEAEAQPEKQEGFRVRKQLKYLLGEYYRHVTPYVEPEIEDILVGTLLLAIIAGLVLLLTAIISGGLMRISILVAAVPWAVLTALIYFLAWATYEYSGGHGKRNKEE